MHFLWPLLIAEKQDAEWILGCETERIGTQSASFQINFSVIHLQNKAASFDKEPNKGSV